MFILLSLIYDRRTRQDGDWSQVGNEFTKRVMTATKHQTPRACACDGWYKIRSWESETFPLSLCPLTLVEGPVSEWPGEYHGTGALDGRAKTVLIPSCAVGGTR